MVKNTNNKFYDLKVKDEYFTPIILVDIILPYISKKNSIVWCPFDTYDSEFVRRIESVGHYVIQSHICQGLDFFSYEPSKYDYVISNPPFSLKLKILKRLMDLGKPFAMLLNTQGINQHDISDFIIDNEIQILKPNKKVSYTGTGTPFISSYFCSKMLPSNLVHVKVQHTNTSKNFIPSSMYGY